MTASRWLPPLRLLTVPGGAELTAAIERCVTERGYVGVLPADCKIELVDVGTPRTFKPRTSLGLARATEARG